jgi:dethiobiotin synthetase
MNPHLLAVDVCAPGYRPDGVAPNRRKTVTARSIYITGTDTGIGKTLVSASLLAVLNDAGVRATGMKPVASGCEQTPDGLRNADALALLAQSHGAPDYARVNPFAFREPVAPQIAAREEGAEITLEPIKDAFAALSTNTDCVVVEGVGGWSVPLSESLMQHDVVRALKLPVILVVGIRLGCINHALLSARAIATDGLELIGWIGSRIDPHMLRADENIATLRERLPAPCLGILPFAANADARRMGAHLEAAVTAISAACRRVPSPDRPDAAADAADSRPPSS